MKKGYVQVYTGNGKGKTTAALGLTLRAVGAGYQVYIGQFIKQGPYSEVNAIKGYLPSVTIEQFGDGFILNRDVSQADTSQADDGWKRSLEAIYSGEFDVVILDEINVAVHLGLIDIQEVLDLVSKKPEHIELILTGRNAHPDLIQAADLVTEMKEVKHYYTKKVPARDGIEK